MADPDHLGKYVIKSVLGKGAMGVVYEGFDPHIERPVAIKTVRTDSIEPELAMLQVPSPPWDDAMLDTAQHALARAIGPMARVLVRKAATQTHDPEALCALLSENIADPATRERFVQAFHHVRASGSTAGDRHGKEPSTAGRPGMSGGTAGKSVASPSHDSSGSAAHARSILNSSSASRVDSRSTSVRSHASW